MKLVAAFAALVSVFGLSSCLDSGDSSPMPQYAVGTFSLGMSGYEFKPDFGTITLETGAYDLTQYGLSSFNGGRAVASFIYPEGTAITETTQRVKVQLQTGCWALPIKRIVEDSPTYSEYTSNIVAFLPPSLNAYLYLAPYPAWVKDRMLTLTFAYSGDDKTEYVLCPDRISTVSQDTLYLNLKVKSASTTSNRLTLDSYSLTPIMDQIEELKPKDSKDSIYFAISAPSKNERGDNVVITTVAKTVKKEALY